MSPPDAAIRVFLVDDHAVVRQGTHEILKRDPTLLVVGEAGALDGLEACLAETRPTVLLLDIHLPDGNGLQRLPDLKACFPALKIVLFSAHGDAQYVRQALALGADGFLSKLTGEEELRAAVHAVVQGDSGPLLSPDLEALMARLRDVSQDMRLTAREQEILLHVAQGLTNQQIARQLCLSVKTVDTHLANLMKKTGVGNRTQLLAHAYERGLL
jgi:DNA-binding NarL/FixJ family response regulator